MCKHFINPNASSSFQFEALICGLARRLVNQSKRTSTIIENQAITTSGLKGVNNRRLGWGRLLSAEGVKSTRLGQAGREIYPPRPGEAQICRLGVEAELSAEGGKSTVWA